MARSLIQLTVFVSGTSEADAERSAIRRVVDELSKQLEKTHSVTLRVLSWPDDFRPGVNTDPQAEINRQVATNYDVYLGILGSRFGTETQRAGSGTEEEFETALSRFLANTRSLRLLLYFKRSSADPFSLDVEQLQKVTRFRDNLGARGVLYRDFQDTADFVGQLKRHLYDLIVEEWRDGSWVEVTLAQKDDARPEQLAEPSAADERGATFAVASRSDAAAALQSVSVDTPANADLELGFLEYIEGFHESVALLTETLERFAQTTTNMNERIRAKTTETESIRQELDRGRQIGGSRAQQEYVSKAKKAVDEAASVLDEYSIAMTADLEKFRSACPFGKRA